MAEKTVYTPREAAYAIAIDWLLAAHELRTDDIAALARGEQHPERFTAAVKQQLAKLHNRLLRQSGMDGMELPE